jgi:RNA polymerase sigma factor (sigma-70 family)
MVVLFSSLSETISFPGGLRKNWLANLTRITARCRGTRSIFIVNGTSYVETIEAAIAIEIPRLRRHARALLYHHIDAEDLVQDCLVTALAKQDMLQDRSRLGGWLFSILNNLFLMHVRSKARRGATVSIDEFAEQLADATVPGERDVALDLARAMGKLSLEHRQILLLLHVEGYSYQEISEILDVPVGTVMSRLARGRERLRQLLEGRGLRVMERAT